MLVIAVRASCWRFDCCSTSPLWRIAHDHREGGEDDAEDGHRAQHLDEREASLVGVDAAQHAHVSGQVLELYWRVKGFEPVLTVWFVNCRLLVVPEHDVTQAWSV